MKTDFKYLNQLTSLASITILLFAASGCNKSEDESAAAFDLTNAKKKIKEANQNFMSLVDSMG